MFFIKSSELSNSKINLLSIEDNDRIFNLGVLIFLSNKILWKIKNKVYSKFIIWNASSVNILGSGQIGESISLSYQNVLNVVQDGF